MRETIKTLDGTVPDVAKAGDQHRPGLMMVRAMLGVPGTKRVKLSTQDGWSGRKTPKV